MLKASQLSLFLCLAIPIAACGGEDVSEPSADGVDVVVPVDVTDEPEVAAALSCAELGHGMPCDDGNACTTEDRCEYEVCAGGSTLVCDDFGVCVQGTCEPLEGCIYEPEPDGTVCYVACFGSAQCLGGTCTVDPETAADCPDSQTPCVDQWGCDPLTGGCTKAIHKPDGVPCDLDESVCTEEVCASGACESTGVVETCDALADANPCWSHTCDPEQGCVAIEFKLNSPCDDSAACTELDVCTTNVFGQELCLGVPIEVDDGNPCTNDTCVAGVVHNTPVTGSACDPGHPCSDSGLCDTVGVCVPSVPCACAELDDCPDGAMACEQDACVF